jgi:oligopeptidase A
MTTSTLLRNVIVRPLGVGIASQLFLMNHANSISHCEGAPTNPLLNQKSVPRFDEIQAAHVVPAVQHDLDQLKRDFGGMCPSCMHLMHLFVYPSLTVFDGISPFAVCWILTVPLTDLVANLQVGRGKQEPTYETVVEELERIQAPLSYSWGVVGHLMGVKNSDDLRKAHDTMQPVVIETYQQIGQNEVVFQALRSIKDKSWTSFDEAQKRILDSSIKQMHLSGVDLPPSQKEVLNKLQLEAAELSTKFSNNVLDSTKQFKLRITDKKDLDGLPDSALALAAQTAVQGGDKEATADAGPWVISLPSYLPCMQHLKNRKIREKLYRAFVTRASNGSTDNEPIIQRILQVNTEMSKLLGFECHAEKSLATKMAGSVEEVMELIEMLREKSFPAAQKELADLREFALKQGCKDELQLWDLSFWSERLRESQYEYKEEELREYLAYPVVLQGLFQLAHRLFGVTIVEAPAGQTPVWHEDVKFYNVMDGDGQQIASFYLDPYSRPGEKRGGAWMDVCLGKSKVLNRIPVAYLTCNGSPPVDGKPSLMTFREVETLFHEFGHGLQHMLTRVVHGEAAGSKFESIVVSV